jgi:hypothetical protein
MLSGFGYVARRAMVATLVAAVLLISVSPALRAQHTPAVGADTSALSATDEVLHTVSRLRELSIEHPVKSGFKSHDEIEESVIKDFNESSTPEEFEASSRTLAKLGMIPGGFPLRDYMVKLLKEQIAGYYDPKTKIFYLASWLPIAEQKTVMAHELTHALQDQHFNLRRFDHWPKGDSDAELAAHALMEGEATIIMIEYSQESAGSRLDVTKLPSLTQSMMDADDSTDSAKYPVLAGAPLVLRENLGFPYVYGTGFVQEVLKHRDWHALNGSYTHLPPSTSAIMHPEKFLAGEQPVKIQISDLAGILGSGYKRADEDVNGEFGYLVLLEQFIDKHFATIATHGWAGDRYALYANKKSGDSVLVQYTTWETAHDAAKFFDAYAQRTKIRYGADDPTHPEPNVNLYETKEGLAYIAVRDKDVVMIEGATSPEQLAALTSATWKSKKSSPGVAATK